MKQDELNNSLKKLFRKSKEKISQDMEDLEEDKYAETSTHSFLSNLSFLNSNPRQPKLSVEELLDQDIERVMLSTDNAAINSEEFYEVELRLKKLLPPEEHKEEASITATLNEDDEYYNLLERFSKACEVSSKSAREAQENNELERRIESLRRTPTKTAPTRPSTELTHLFEFNSR